MSGLVPVDNRLFFHKQPTPQSALIRNQSSGQINSPEAGKQVPGDVAKSMIIKHESFADKVTGFIQGVVSKSDADKHMNDKLVQYAREYAEERKGLSVDTYA